MDFGLGKKLGGNRICTSDLGERLAGPISEKVGGSGWNLRFG